jgi:hypothetical protein
LKSEEAFEAKTKARRQVPPLPQQWLRACKCIFYPGCSIDERRGNSKSTIFPREEEGKFSSVSSP